MAEVVEVESGLAKETSRLVYVGGDGDVYEAGYGDGNESEPRRLTWGWSEGEDDDGRLQYVWPSYSPDGSHVACFGVGAGESAHAGLYAVGQHCPRLQQFDASFREALQSLQEAS